MSKKKPGLDDLVLLEDTHRYFLSGQELTGVTNALEVVGITDFSKVPPEILERARLIGDHVHALAKLYALSDLDESSVDPRLEGFFNSVNKFFSDRVKKVLYVEAKVFDLGLGYAGQLDIVYLSHQDKVCLDDYKTSRSAHPAARLQTAAYRRPFEILYKVKVHERAGVYLDGAGDYERVPHSGPGDFDDFARALGTARYKIKNNLWP